MKTETGVRASRRAAVACIVLGLVALLPANALGARNVTISTSPTMNGAFNSFGIFIPIGDNAVVNLTDLQNVLSTGNAKITTGTTGSQPGVITTATPVTWSAHTLTLDAYTSIAVNGTPTSQTTMSATSTGALALTTNDGGTGGQLSFSYGNVTFASTSQTLTIGDASNSHLYVLVDNGYTHFVNALNGATSGNYYAVIGNVDASGHSPTNAPINSPLPTTFEGLGNSMSNLTINDGTPNHQDALFAQVNSGGAINDFNLVNVTVQATAGNYNAASFAAGLVAVNLGTLSGDSVAGTGSIQISCGGCTNIQVAYIGGLVAENEGTVTNSSASEAVTSHVDGTAGGGLVGINLGQSTVAATIQNSSSNATVTASSGVDDHVGGLIGFNSGGTIQNSNASGPVTCAGTFGNAGGLVGWNNSANGQPSVLGYIENSYATGDVGSTSACTTVGGLVAVNDTGGVIGTTATSSAVSYAKGKVQAGSAGSSAGGLAGTNGGIIKFSYATGNVTAHGTLGGLVGENGLDAGASGSTISQSFATGTVTDTGVPAGDACCAYGGLVGNNDLNGEIDNSYSKGDLISLSGADGGLAGVNAVPGANVGSTNTSATYEIGNVNATGTATCIGGFAGKNDVGGNNSSVVNSYWDTKTSGQANGVGQGQTCDLNGGITGLTSAQLKAGLPNGFVTSIWTRDPAGQTNGGYPYLIQNPPP